jgi:hypothetical protein
MKRCHRPLGSNCPAALTSATPPAWISTFRCASRVFSERRFHSRRGVLVVRPVPPINDCYQQCRSDGCTSHHLYCFAVPLCCVQDHYCIWVRHCTYSRWQSSVSVTVMLAIHRVQVVGDTCHHRKTGSLQAYTRRIQLMRMHSPSKCIKTHP